MNFSQFLISRNGQDKLPTESARPQPAPQEEINRTEHHNKVTGNHADDGGGEQRWKTPQWTMTPTALDDADHEIMSTTKTIYCFYQLESRSTPLAFVPLYLTT